MHRVEVLPAELRQILFFDLDDTLIHCNKYFNEILSRFADWMIARFQGTTRDEVLEKQVEFDLAGVRKVGFVKDRFPESLVETYDYFSALTGRTARDQERNELRELGYDVYDQQYEPYPDMEETLETLKAQGHKLCLYTGGDRDVQQAKVNQLGLKRFFEGRIYVERRKDEQAMERLLRSTDSDRSKTWMIGNSARTDILPALKSGIHAIHIPTADEWEYNRADIRVQPKGAFFRLNRLAEVPETIERYITGK